MIPRLSLAATLALLALGLALAVVPDLRSEADAPLASASSPAITLPSAAASAVPTIAPSPEATVAPADPPGGPIPDGYRIEIPRLGIDLPVQEGDLQRDIDQQRTPEGYAFHLPGTAIPGRNGNTFLYAHARRGMFLALWKVRPGDEVLVRVPGGGVLTYVVGRVLPRVLPTDVSTTRPTASEQLTLQTSTGPNPGDPRFVVLAFPRAE